MKFFAKMIKSHFLLFLFLIFFSCGGGGSSGNSGSVNSNTTGAGVAIGDSANPGGSAGDSVTPPDNNTPAPDNGPAPDLGDNGEDANPSNNAGSGGGNIVNLNPTNNGNTLDFTFIDTSSTAAGITQITINLENTTSFQAITQKLGQNIFSTLKDANGNSLVSALNPPNSFAPFSNSNVNSLSFPVDPDQTNVDTGSYNLEVGMDVNTNFRTLFLAKHDSNLNSGVLYVNIFLVGVAVQGYNNDIQDAIDIFSQIYSQVGITIIPTVITSLNSSPGILPNPSSGSSFYSTNSESLAVNIYIGLNVSADASTGGGNILDVLGLVHSIPGPFIKSTASAVAISLEPHYGADSVFNPFEIELLGETMAHESGHYLGLFHPVEFADATHATFLPGDRLSDTAECTTLVTCNGTGLSQNLMFPTPVTGVLQQRTLSGQQKALLNLATIVD